MKTTFSKNQQFTPSFHTGDLEKSLSDSWNIIEGILRDSAVYSPVTEGLYYKDEDGNFIKLAEAPAESAVRMIGELLQKHKKNAFITIKQPILYQMVMELPVKELRFIVYLIYKTGLGNVVKETQAQMMKELGCAPSTMSKYIKIAESKNLIRRRGPKNRMEIILNPAIGFKGKFHYMKSIMSEFEPIIMRKKKEVVEEEFDLDFE